MTTSNDKDGTIFKSPENKWVLIWGAGEEGQGQKELMFLFYVNLHCLIFIFIYLFFTKSRYFFRD